MLPGQGGHGRFPPLQRVEIEQLACCQPSGLGLQMTHWATRSLALIASRRGIVPQIAHSTVALILRAAELQPHRSRYWKTPTLNAEFRQRAAGILWCYERALDLAARDELVICLDEKPNIQALERAAPTQPMRPGQIERREFEYLRHGTVNFLVALLVHSGKMRGWCLPKNDSVYLCRALRELFYQHRQRKRIHLIWDNGPSHISDYTAQFLRNYQDQVRVLCTPPHASWLDQAELLLRAFTDQYLDRGEWLSREHLIDHLGASWPEYNRLFAHPFDWSWTRHSMNKWIERHSQ